MDQHDGHPDDPENAMREQYKELVAAIAKRYAAIVPYVPLEDLQQAGEVGLHIAWQKYQPDKGSFSNYAVAWIRGEIIQCIRDACANIPRSVYEPWRKVVQAHDRLMEQLERKPTLEEIAEATALTVQEVQQALQNAALFFPSSLEDRLVSSEGGPEKQRQQVPKALQTNPLDLFTNQLSVEWLVAAGLNVLRPRYRQILLLFYLEDQSLGDIATTLNRDVTNVKVTKHRAEEALRGYIITALLKGCSTQQNVTRMLDLLESGPRQVVVLFYLERLSLHKIAKQLGTNLKAVKTAKHDAERVLWEVFGRHWL
jgi:RNA polymerase sigma factor (sigma-70 family)